MAGGRWRDDADLSAARRQRWGECRRGGRIFRCAGARERTLGVLGSPAAWRLFAERRVRGCGSVVRGGAEPAVKTEVAMSGQLALAVEREAIAPAAVWETLPPERSAAR